MSRELVEEILELEAHAEQQITHAKQEAEHIIRKAHEDSVHIEQDAERTIEASSAERIEQHTKKLQQEKAAALKEAQTAAASLAKQITPRITSASELLKTQFLEQLNDAS